MRKLAIILLFYALFFQHPLRADYVHTWTVEDERGCQEFKTVKSDALGCMNYYRPCGRDYWSTDGLGWNEHCNGVVIPSNATSDPFVVAPNYGIIISVATGTGGYFSPLGLPSTGNGGSTTYSMWEFHPTGTNYVTMPPTMVQIH